MRPQTSQESLKSPTEVPTGRGLQTRVICSLCQKIFSTKSHLRRHEASHAPSAKLTCNFCGGAYRRRDVLRRHFQTCKQKGDYQVPLRRKPGRKRKACNACAECRSFCDGDFPCEACLQRGIDCSSTRIRGDDSKSNLPRQPLTLQSPETLDNARKAGTVGRSVKLSIPFLLHYTNVESESRYESLRLLSQCNLADTKDGCCAVDHQSHNLNLATESWESLFRSFINTATLDMSSSAQAALADRFDYTELQNVATKLLTLLAGCKHSTPEERVDPDKAKQFFTPTNIAEFIEAFFNSPFHSHFLSPASFRLNQASGLLVLPMVLLGAVYTSHSRATELEIYSSNAEHLIFDGPEFQTLMDKRNDSLDDHRTLEMLQAAMLVLNLQAYKEDPDSIRQTRLHRLPRLFTAIRTIDLNQITNDCVPNTSNWEAYCLREGLVRIMAGIYLLDCYCVIFFRYPTQLQPDELTFEIPQRDNLFHARDATEWAQLSSQDVQPRAPVRLRTALRDFMRADGLGPLHKDYVPQTLFGSFLVLSALQTVLFDLLALHTFNDDLRAFEPVERGLDRWKAHWDALCRTTEPASAQRAGFIIHAVEYWWVAKALVKQPSAALTDDNNDSFLRMVDRLMQTDGSPAGG
ncbi:uncharacterized protein BO97DRAFT_440714 [Aspergillus homomorphus CBS 101889]|uniref:C2H2-type domain-containing protein n=1 Tax=Aspergillus homomorphus (strain CBS 101889) TaxID=1450537 RepID=A0A395I7V7_ASPHC|nr:hypothetical protein BO97DRAFT_440714 [Aspergillus homomorphus CBS 101889]RAL16181.1 hypothetical protein BO97DRAFT_440714 [Aspergillus homomorphus CBS 101889]